MTSNTSRRSAAGTVVGLLCFALVVPAAPATAAQATAAGTTGPAAAPVATDGAEPVPPTTSDTEFDESGGADAGDLPAEQHVHEHDGSAEPDPAGEPSDPAPSGGPTADAVPGALLADAKVSGFGVVGVTWTGGLADENRLVVHVRTTEKADAVGGASWSDWEEIAVEPSPRGELDGTEPVVVGNVAHVQARVAGPDVATVRDLELTVIDPGTSTADDDVPVPPPETSPAGTAVPPPPVTGRPSIASRAAWGADESIMTWNPRQGDIKGAAIHHTSGTNTYSRSDVPRIIRGIYAYHAQTRDWGDIGYNFLVDRYGRIWEGRAGGVTRETIGGHARGYNTNSTGISVIGNYDQVRPTNASVSAVVRLVAWKLSLHGIPATGGVTIEGTRLDRVFGHRDVSSTACPGRYLYPKLGEIRRRAQAAQDQVAADQAQKGIPDGTFVQGTNGKLALVEKGRRHIAYCAVVRKYGERCSEAVQVASWQWDAFEPGGRLHPTVTTTDGRLFRVTDGRKHEAFDVESLRRTGQLTETVHMHASALRALPYSSPVVRPGVIVVNRRNGNHLLVTNGNQYGEVNKYLRERTPLKALDTGRLDGASVSRMTRVSTTSGVVSRKNGREFLLSTQRLIRIDGTGRVRAGTTTQHWSWWLMRELPRSSGRPDLVVVRVREQSQRYVLRDGVLRPVSKSRARQLNGGTDPRVHVILKVTKWQLPVGSRL